MQITQEFKCINNSIEKLLLILFAIGIILIPFDNMPYFKSILGELSYKASVYPFILIIFIILVNTIITRKIYVNKNKVYYLLYLFLGTIIGSTLLNIFNIFSNSLKGRSGAEKLILQLMVIVFMLLVMYSVDAIISLQKVSLYTLRKYIFLSAIPVIIYGCIELLHLSGIIDFSNLIKKISYLIQTYYRGEVYLKGIRSVTGEVSYFAMYLAFAFPWIISFIFTKKKKVEKIFYSGISLLLLILMIFSKSRTAYAIMFIQILLFIIFILAFKVDKKQKILIVKSIVIVCTIFLIFNVTILDKIGGDINSVSKISISSLVESLTDPNNMSNVARSGMQKAAFNMGINSYGIGIGIGQYGFNAPKFISENALRSDEVKVWINDSEATRESWPPAFSIYPRIFAEQGVIGLIVWLMFLIIVLLKYLKKIWKSDNNFIGLSLAISYICILIIWWNFDTFVSFQFWILVPFMTNIKK